MITRHIQDQVLKSLANFPAVGILGSRQVGKTTLAKTIQKRIKGSIYLDMELPSDLNKLQDAELYLNQYPDSLIIIDEIQKIPELFSILRALIDKKRINGRFLILGSASPDLIKQSSESLAGRIIYHELNPFNIIETGMKNNINKLWLRGGYPDSYLADTNDLSYTWREAFIKTYLERDIPQLGIRVPSPQIRRFWTMLTHLQSQLWNASQIANSLGITAPTVNHYLDILEETFIVRKLQPYFPNIKKRLIKSSKIYIRDSGLLHALINITNIDNLQGHSSLGASWEGFVIEQIFSILPSNWGKYFYRTSAGAEIDLVVFKSAKECIAIEIKYSSQPQVTKGFWTAFSDLKCKKGFIVYPGSETYPINKNVSVLSVNNLARLIQDKG